MQNSDRPAEPTVPQADKQPDKKLWRRIIAAFMAFILIAGLLLGYAAQIRFAQLNYLGTVLEHAAAVTADNTGYLSESGLKRAWQILRYAVGKPRSYDEFEMYTSLAIARTEYAEAIPYMLGCIEKYPGESPRGLAVLYLRLGSLYALSDDVENAITAFEQAVETDDTLADAYLLRAQMNSLAGRKDTVAEDLRRYDQLTGEDPALAASMASLYESAGDYENAVRCYSEAITYSGESQPELMAARARCNILQQEMDAAKQDLITFFAEGGADTTGEYNLMLGLCRMDDGEFELALRAFHNSLNAGYAQKALVYSQCVLCAYIIGDYAAVIADGEKALEELTKPDQQTPDALAAAVEGMMSEEELHHWIGLAKMAGEDFEGAKTEFLAIRDPDKAPEGIFYYLGLCCASLGEYAQAITHYSESIAKNQMISLSTYNRGVSYLQLNMLEEGLTDLVVVLQRNDDADATSSAAALLKDLGVEVVFD